MTSVILVNGVFPPDEYGGAENYVLRTAISLQRRGIDASVLTTTPRGGRESFHIHEETQEGISVYRFSPLNLSHLSEGTGGNIVSKALWHQLDTVNPHAKRVVSNFLAAHQPDVVHTNNFMGITASTGKAIAESNARYVHTLHDYSLICPKSNLLRDMTLPGDELGVCEEPPVPCRMYARAKRRMIGQPNLVIGPSQHVIDVHRKHGFFKGVEATRIQHGIEESAESISPNSSKSVLYVGKHLRAKGLETLFEAAHETPEVTVHLCGTGPYDEQSQEAAAELENVEYHGFVSDEQLWELRREVAAAVVPSIWMENSPLTIYESFAEGLPVIGADIGGIPELVDETRGWLFPPEDSAALAKRMRAAISTERLSRRRAALEWAREHSMERHIDRLLKAYSA
jgi:glycosyltransferase involved in cell wall biosynthesis